MTATKYINYSRLSPDAFGHLVELSQALQTGPLGAPLIELVWLRVSQINRCAFCLDMHSAALRARGEDQRKLDTLAAWRESPLFDERERAALLWAESLAALARYPIPESALDEARQQFDEREISDLTFAVATINAWNMLSIGLRRPVPTSRSAHSVPS